MTHSKTIKRPDGVRYRIEARSHSHGTDVLLYLDCNGLWEYLASDKMSASTLYKHVTPAEIHAAKMELWEKMKPEL